MDALSQALSAVRTTGAIFFNVECSAPWGIEVPAVDEVVDLLAPGTERLVNYHLIADGEATIHLGDGEPLHANPGDVVVLPHGDAHTVTQGSPAQLVQSQPPLADAISGHPQTIQLGGGGARTTIICGFFGCERHAERTFLAGLPPLFKVGLRSDATGAWLENSVRHMVDEAQSGQPGTSALLSKMAEALFVATLRRYMRELPDDHVGWLAGARDPVVARALALLHDDPARPWTVADLATAAGASRSVLGERFAHFLGESPLAYLARWRVLLAARALTTTHKTALEIALEVGYRSESAFSRAFKRELGVPPGRYRKRSRRMGSTADV